MTRRSGVLPAGRGGTALSELVVAVALLLVVAALIAWLAPTSFGGHPASCLDSRCFCEAVGVGVLRQGANALSCLGFCVAAVAVLIRGRRLPPRSRERSLLPALAATLAALGAGSLAYHGTLTYAGQLLDVQGMYLLGILLVVGSLWRRGRLTGRAALLLVVTLLVVLGVAQGLWPQARRLLFVVVLLPGIALEGGLARSSRPLRFGVGALILAASAWVADVRGWWCDPLSWLQGHAVWHLGCAVAGYLLVEHYLVTARAPQSDSSRVGPT